jgi:hypothetical protein
LRFFALAAFAALSACATVQPTRAPGQNVTVSDAFDGGAIAVAPGGIVNVELISAAGAPYEWVVVETPAFLRLASSEKIAAPQPANGEIIVGGPVTNRFVFQATGTGSGRLQLALRSFVGNRDVARTWTGTITVR